MPGPEPSVHHETADFWVINKPPGWTVQRDANAPSILQWLNDQQQTAYPVHRLDKPTSGLLLVARNTAANQRLSQAFARREIDKTYLALSDARPKKKQGWIRGDMKPARRSQWKLLREQTNPAVTRFQSSRLGDGVRGFVLWPKTGKTHQLRVAMKSLGCPIIGDTLYGGSPAERLYLHAWQLRFEDHSHHYRFQINPDDNLFQEWFQQQPPDEE